MSDYSNFLKGVITTFIAVGLVSLFFGYLGRAWVYADNKRADRMESCQKNGYTWGECYNVIVGDQSAFTK